MTIDVTTKTLQNYVNILAITKKLLQDKNIVNTIYNAIDNDFNFKIDVDLDVDVDNNICGLIVNKDYDNITVTLYTLQGNFKMYIDIYNYIDFTLKSLYIYLRKNSVLDVDTNTQFIFNVDNNNYSIDYKQTINKLQIYLD